MPSARNVTARRLGLVGIALTAWDIWRQIPPQHRKRIAREARMHAPSVARAIARQVRLARDYRANRRG